MTPRLMLVNMLATLAYLGLAILGWGGFAAFFAHPALIAVAIVVFVLTGAGLFTNGNISSGEHEDRSTAGSSSPSGLSGCWPPICRPTRTGRSSGRWMGMPFAGSALFSLPPVVRCDSGRSLCSATGSAGWWPSSPGTRW